MTDLVIWFGIWDDYIERLEDPFEAEAFRAATKVFVAQSLGLGTPEQTKTSLHPLIKNFEGVARKVLEAYDIGKFPALDM